jgi:hypothetical protein
LKTIISILFLFVITTISNAQVITDSQTEGMNYKIVGLNDSLNVKMIKGHGRYHLIMNTHTANPDTISLSFNLRYAREKTRIDTCIISLRPPNKSGRTELIIERTVAVGKFHSFDTRSMKELVVVDFDTGGISFICTKRLSEGYGVNWLQGPQFHSYHYDVDFNDNGTITIKNLKVNEGVLDMPTNKNGSIKRGGKPNIRPFYVSKLIPDRAEGKYVSKNKDERYIPPVSRFH